MARYYNRFLPDLFAAAQRAFIDAAIRLRAATDIPRLFLSPPAAVLLVLPGGLPRRFPRAEPAPPMLSKACIAASSLLRSFLSSTTISERFMGHILAFLMTKERKDGFIARAVAVHGLLDILLAGQNHDS